MKKTSIVISAMIMKHSEESIANLCWCSINFNAVIFGIIVHKEFVSEKNSNKDFFYEQTSECQIFIVVLNAFQNH